MDATSNYTRADAERDFNPSMRYDQILELASRFGVTRGMLRKWRRSQLLKASNIPGRAKWKREDLLKLINPQ